MVVLVLITVMTVTAMAQQRTGSVAPGFFDFWKLPRVWVGALFCIAGLVLLAKSWICHHLRLFFLVIIFFFFGILYILPLGSFTRGLSLHPSPLCLIEKPFIFLKAGRGVPIIFLSIVASILVLSIIGNKLFCGWVCPVGVLQEIIHRIPFPEHFKKKLPFKWTNMIRIAVFLLFLVLLFFAGFSIYGYLNPFEFFHFGFQLIAIVMLLVTLIASLFIFRPFCYFLCPLGLITWLAEHIAIVKVKVDGDKCTKCNICVEKSPCPTVPSILEGKKSRPDCHPCGRCIEVCPEKALRFRA
jgi:polyferredoxin